MPVIEKPTTEHATVVQAIRALPCQPGTSKLDETVALALHALEQQEGRREREIYIMTDGQAVPWQGFRDAAKKEDWQQGTLWANQWWQYQVKAADIGLRVKTYLEQNGAKVVAK